MIVARKIVHNVIFNAISKVLSTVLALVGIGFIMRYLGVDGYGEYAVTLTFFSFFGAIGDLGLYTVTAREISRKGADEIKILGNIFTLRLLFSGVVLLCVPAAVFFLPYSEHLKIALYIAGVSFFFSSSYMVLNGLFQKHLIMYQVALVELIGKILQLAVIVCSVWYDLGFLAITSSLLVFMVFNFVCVLWLALKKTRIRLAFDFRYWRSFLIESLPMGLAGIVTFLYFKFDTIILSVLQNSEAVGIYNGAYKVIENLVFFPAMIVGLMLPIFSRYIFSAPHMFQQYADKTFKVFVVFVIPVCVGTLFFADDIMQLLGGGSFSSSSNALRILVVALVCMFFGQLFNAVLLAGNLQKKLVMMLSFCAIVNVFANFLFIPIFSYTAAAVISVCTELLVVVMALFIMKKYIHYTPSLPEWLKISVAMVCMSVAFFAFEKYTNFILAGTFGILVYGIVLAVTNAVKKEEISGIFMKTKTQLPDVETV